MEGLHTEVAILFSLTSMTIFGIALVLNRKGFLSWKHLGGYCKNQNRALNSKNQEGLHQNANYRSQECFICLTEVMHKVVLPCSHTFCGQCTMNIHIHNGKIDCPLCRKPVPIIYTKFHQSEDPELYEEIQVYNEQYRLGSCLRKPIGKFQRYMRIRFGLHPSIVTTIGIILSLCISLICLLPLLTLFTISSIKRLGILLIILTVSKMLKLN
ncbi:unnamed protein product [Moneuplotes crassus]|uniref:RING-type domain-containing protein n=1 Tax=Euplotes crassus TaxID=5936 RepID=A0AAD1XZ40_EUPCR|nr:unnamed protein product [Moneuplotes crassus]